MPTMNEIEDLTRDYARAWGLLALSLDSLEKALAVERDKRITGIKGLAVETAAARERLSAAIEAAPELFVKPRSVVVENVKVGFQKDKGKVVFSLKPEKVIAKIRALFSKAKAESLIAVKESPVKEALEKLPADELKKIGVKIDGAGDRVLIKHVDTDVEKLVARMLKTATAAPADDGDDDE